MRGVLKYRNYFALLPVLYFLFAFIFKYPFSFNIDASNNANYPTYLSQLLLLLCANIYLLFNKPLRFPGVGLILFFVNILILLYRSLLGPKFGLYNEHLT